MRANAIDKSWQAESDASTLARAEEIRADRARHSAAKAHATKEMSKYAKVAKGGEDRKPSPKPTSRSKK